MRKGRQTNVYLTHPVSEFMAARKQREQQPHSNISIDLSGADNECELNLPALEKNNTDQGWKKLTAIYMCIILYLIYLIVES